MLHADTALRALLLHYWHCIDDTAQVIHLHVLHYYWRCTAHASLLLLHCCHYTTASTLHYCTYKILHDQYFIPDAALLLLYSSTKKINLIAGSRLAAHSTQIRPNKRDQTKATYTSTPSAWSHAAVCCLHVKPSFLPSDINTFSARPDSSSWTDTKYVVVVKIHFTDTSLRRNSISHSVNFLKKRMRLEGKHGGCGNR